MKSLLWKLPVNELQTLIEKLEHENNVDIKCIEEIKHLINCLDIYLDEKSDISSNVNEIFLKIYATGTLSNNETIYATSRFHGKARFSDIAIAMENVNYLTDNGICYGKVFFFNLINFSSAFFITIFINLELHLLSIKGINVSGGFI